MLMNLPLVSLNMSDIFGIDFEIVFLLSCESILLRSIRIVCPIDDLIIW